jgi:hypothetical protein
MVVILLGISISDPLTKNVLHSNKIKDAGKNPKTSEFGEEMLSIGMFTFFRTVFVQLN